MAESKPPAAPETVPPTRAAQPGTLLRFWRGDFSLNVSVWGFGAGGTALIALALLMAMIVAFVTNMHNRHRLAISLLVIVGVTVLITLWQCVGIWRSATQHVAQGKSQGYAFAVKAFVVFTILQIVLMGFVLEPLWKAIEAVLDGFAGSAEF